MSVGVFISSARANQAQRAQVVSQLIPLVNTGLIRLLESPLAGIDEEETDALLAEAQIVLLLVTPEYFESASFGRNWQPIVERQAVGHVKIRPLLLTPVLWEGQKIGGLAFKLLKPLPSDGSFVFENGQSARRLREIAKGIEEQAHALTPQAVVPKADVATDPLEQALDTVTRSLSRSNVVLFVGSSGTPVESSLPPRPFEVARELLSRLKLIGADYEHLLPPADVAAALYAASTSPSNLSNVMDEIYRPRSGVATLQKKIAALLRGTAEQRREKKGLIDDPQIIVTTAVDTSLETALLAEGISFSRVVQYWSADKLTVNQYLDVKLLAPGVCTAHGVQPGDARSWDTPCDDPSTLVRLITACGRFEVEYDKQTPQIGASAGGEMSARQGQEWAPRHTSSNAMAELNVKRLQQPVLYKIRGSLDLRNSVALSTDQYIELVLKATVGQRVPKEIAQQVANNIALFLGFGVLDSDFRLTYGLFREQIIKGHDDSYERYLVQLPPTRDPGDSYRQMERYWLNLITFALEHRKVKTLEIAPADFLDRLATNLAIA